jgi:hypothetical protein
MGAITGTKVSLTEFAGQQKILLITATIAATSDTITLTEATHGITEIVGILGHTITGGMDADFTSMQVSFSGLVLTVVTKQADGAASDEFTGTTCSIALLVK